MSAQKLLANKNLVIIAVIMIVAHLFYKEAYAIKPDKTYIKNPKDLGLEYESVLIKTLDGYDLSGWLVQSKRDNSKGTIIFSGPDAGNKSYLLDLIPIYIHDGYNVMLFDYRGFGESQDFDIDADMLIYAEFLDDLNSVIDYVKSKAEKNIVLFGISMGAAISLGVAGQRNDISTVIADGAYTTTDKVLANLHQKFMAEGNSRRLKKPDNFPSNALPINAVAQVKSTNIFLLTGSEDKVTTPEMAVELYTKCPSPQKSLWIAAGATHGRIAQVYGKLYFDNVLAFLNRFSL